MARTASRRGTERSDRPAFRARSSRARRRGRARARRRASRARARPPRSARPAAVRGRARRRSRRASRRTCRTRASTRGCRSRCRRGSRPRASPSSGAMPQPRMPFERGQCATATSCSARSAISSSSACDAVRCDDARAEQPVLCERADPGRARRWDEHARANASQLPVPVRRHSVSASLSARWVAIGSPSSLHAPVEVERAGVRRVRRDAEADARRRACRAIRSRIGSKRSRCGARVVSEHLEVDDPAQPEVGARGRRRAAEAAVADGRDPGAQALEGAEPGDRLHVLEVDPRLRSMWRPIQSAKARPSPKPA